MRRLALVAVTLGLTVLGAVTGTVGAFLQGYSFELGGTGVPVGILLALLATLAAFVHARAVTGSRLGVLGPGIGWVVAVLVLSTRRPEGDLVVPATVPGYVYLLGGAVAVGLVVAFPFGVPGAAAAMRARPPAPSP